MIPVTMCRFYCPLHNVENIPGGSFKIQGWRRQVMLSDERGRISDDYIFRLAFADWDKH
jgi:hypothetical protein